MVWNKEKFPKTIIGTPNIFCCSSQDNFLSAGAYEKLVTFVFANLFLQISDFVL